MSQIIATVLYHSEPNMLDLNAAQDMVSFHAFLYFIVIIEAYNPLILMSLIHWSGKLQRIRRTSSESGVIIIIIVNVQPILLFRSSQFLNVIVPLPAYQ
jgi:hypothetical protein